MIFEAIAAIKIANEAIGAIKEFAGHVNSVGAMGKDLTKLADAKADIEKAAKDGDMDAFFALEEIKNHEAEIKRQFIYAGRPRLWEDYCTFITNRKQLRENAAKRKADKKAKRKKLIKDILLGTIVAVGILGAVGIIVYAFYWIVKLKGK
jgi:nitrate reductase NapE component